MTNEHTPIWLNIKPEYIDENLNEFIGYLAYEVSKTEPDAFYIKTSELFNIRIKQLIEELQAITFVEEEQSPDAEGLLKAVKLLAAYILLHRDKPELYKESFFFLLVELSKMTPIMTEDLVEVALNTICKKEMMYPGFTWDDIVFMNSPDELSDKIVNNVKFGMAPAKENWYQKNGSIKLSDGLLRVYALNKSNTINNWLSYQPSLGVLDDMLAVYTANSERIRQHEENDVERVAKFTADFIAQQKTVKPTPTVSLKEYEKNAIVPVRFLGCKANGDMMVESVDGTYEYVSGIIPESEDVFYYYKAHQFSAYLQEGDIFDAQYVDPMHGVFSLKKTFLSALLESTVKKGDEVLAQFRTTNSKGDQMWWTENGYPVYVSAASNENLNPGTYAILKIDRVSSNGYIAASILDVSEERFSEDDSRKYCIDGLLYPLDHTFATAPKGITIESSIVRGLYQLLMQYQRALGKATERFRVISLCRILATLSGSEKDLQYLDVIGDYLKNLIFFAESKNEKISSLVPSPELIDLPPIHKRQQICEILKCYGSTDDDLLSDTIETETDPVVLQLAKLVQSCNRIDEVYPAIKGVIKHEITRFLAVETEDHTDFEETSGPNLGVENDLQEFKTSFFFAPKDAYEQNQEKNVFKDICSFLNTKVGGVLYLGVHNEGYVLGLEGELDYLEKKTSRAYTGLDGYMRYIADRSKEYFDLDVRLNIRMTPMYENRVIAISVSPYRNSVVEFEGVPYIRWNGESVRMNKSTRREIEKELMATEKDVSEVVFALKEAIREKSSVIIHGYWSSNSGEARDRKVEPFAFIGDNLYIWCYDLDKNQVRPFRISRMGSIEMGEPWKMESKHKKGKIDAFYFTGDKEIPVKIELDMLAKDLLTEEFPEAVKDLIDLKDGRWMLDTVVYGIKGIGRFYVGLIDHIEIIDAPELREYTKEFISKNQGKL